MSRSATDGHRNGAAVHHAFQTRECTSENERLSSCFGVSQSNLEQPSRDLLAPVRDLNDLSIASKVWWTAHLPSDDARRPDVPATVGRPSSDR